MKLLTNIIPLPLWRMFLFYIENDMGACLCWCEINLCITVSYLKTQKDTGLNL